MKRYKIINDSGVDYKFMSGFCPSYDKSWLGQIVNGSESFIKDCITVDKPFSVGGTYTAHKDNFMEIKTVVVTVEGGVVQDIDVPEGVEVILRDYDIEGIDDLKEDQEYVESVWECVSDGVLITKKE